MVPRIDISALFSESAEHAATDAAIIAAAGFSGFMTICGLPPEVPIDPASRRALLRLFDLPAGETRRLWRQKFDPAHRNSQAVGQKRRERMQLVPGRPHAHFREQTIEHARRFLQIAGTNELGRGTPLELQRFGGAGSVEGSEEGVCRLMSSAGIREGVTQLDDPPALSGRVFVAHQQLVELCGPVEREGLLCVFGGCDGTLACLGHIARCVIMRHERFGTSHA